MTTKKVLENNNIWGENKELEKFWLKLASGKYVVLIYKNSEYKYIKLPKPTTQKFKKLFNDFDKDKNIKAILSSSMSSDIYALYLYPKAKDNTVEYVIENYKKFFKLLKPVKLQDNDLIMKKVMVPY